MKDLSIVLVNWNGRHLLADTLKHLPRDCELWVVDNASEDDSVSWIKKHYPHIHLIVNPQNYGFGRANNQVLRQLSTPYVLMLNTDAHPLPGCLEKSLAWFKEHSQVGLMGGQLIHANGKLQNSVSPRIDLLTECVNRKLMAWLRREKTKNFPKPCRVQGVIGAAMLARLESLKQVDFFDEDYFFFFEETDLCYRLEQNSWEVWHHPDFRVTHAQGQSARKKKIASRIEFHLSRELFFYKHFGRQQAKTLHLWQERRLWLTRLIYSFFKTISFDLWQPSKLPLVSELSQWYLHGCPENRGLRP